MIGPLVRVLVVGLVLLVTISVMTVGMLKREPPQPEAATVLPEFRQVPQFSLTTTTGDAFKATDFEGRYSLVFFGFTNCPDVCPLTLQVLADVRAALKDRSLEVPDVVFITVDPDRDDRAQVTRYLGYFDATMTGLLGPAPSLKPLLDFFGVGVHKMQADGEEYTVTHSGAVFMLNPAGEYVAVFSSPNSAEQVVRDYLVIRRLMESA